jgi:LSD1 subclass zinc finger protein
MQFDRVEARHVVEPEARPHSDAEAVPPVVTHHRDRFDFVQGQPTGPESGTEMPSPFPAVHFNSQGWEQEGNGNKNDQRCQRQPLHRPPGDRSIKCSEDQAKKHHQSAALGVTLRHSCNPAIWKHGSNRGASSRGLLIIRLVAKIRARVHNAPRFVRLSRFRARLQLGENVTRSSQPAKSSVTRAGKNRRLRGDKPADNDDNPDKLCRRNSPLRMML